MVRRWWQRRRAEKAERLRRRQELTSAKWEAVVTFTDDLPEHVRRFTGRMAFSDPDYDMEGSERAQMFADRVVAHGVWVNHTLIPPSRVASVTVRQARD